MSRPLRVEYPGAFYHVMNRSIGGVRIFADKRESERFLDNLSKSVERFALVIHAFCLMPTHYHLLVQINEANLSSAIQWLNVSYAAYFNKKHERKGHLFQGRFKAILVDGDEYIKELSRYIHLNPVQAGMVEEKPYLYPWSSYSYFIGRSKGPDWLNTDWTLGCFAENKKAAEKIYREFVEGAQLDSIKNPLDDVVEGFVLGDSNFVEWVKDAFLRDRKSDEIPQLKHLLPRPSVETVINEICRTLGTEEDKIRQRGPKRNIGRDLAIYLARECTGLSCKELGGVFGGISGAAITMKCKGVTSKLEEDVKLKKKVEKMRERILNF